MGSTNKLIIFKLNCIDGQVGNVSADTQRLQIKDLQEGHEYLVRILAKNEVGLSDPLEMDEPLRVVRPPGLSSIIIAFIKQFY